MPRNALYHDPICRAAWGLPPEHVRWAIWNATRTTCSIVTTASQAAAIARVSPGSTIRAFSISAEVEKTALTESA